MADEQRGFGGDKTPKGSTPAIETYLKGITFPATKEDLINKARENNAPEEIVHVIELFPSKAFASVSDVARAAGEVK